MYYCCFCSLFYGKFFYLKELCVVLTTNMNYCIFLSLDPEHHNTFIQKIVNIKFYFNLLWDYLLSSFDDLFCLYSLLLHVILVQALFPDNTYGVDSGGDPKVIPKLTFEEFKVCFAKSCWKIYVIYRGCANFHIDIFSVLFVSLTNYFKSLNY